MIDWILEPLGYAFVLRGMAAGLLTAVACGLLSAFVVWRGMAFVGDALAHAILPGIVVAYALGISLFLGALGAGTLAVLGIGLLTQGQALREDTAIGVVFAGFFALGILILSRVAAYQDLSHILFGNILGVSGGDLKAMAAVVAVVVLLLGLTYKELLVTSFDPVHSVAIGLSPSLIRYLLLMMVALTTVVAIQTVGVVMVLALLVTPGAAASLLSKNLRTIMGLSLLISLTATVAGFYASFYGDWPSGPSIVIALSLIFLLALAGQGVKKIKKVSG